MTHSPFIRVRECVEALTRGFSEATPRGPRSFPSLLHLLCTVEINKRGEGGNPNKGGSRAPSRAGLNLAEEIRDYSVTVHEMLWRAEANEEVSYKMSPQVSVDSILCDIATMSGRLEETRPELVESAAVACEGWVKRARVLLNFEAREVQLADTVCHACGGALAVPEDASGPVRCIGAPLAPPCGQSYPHAQWLDLLAAQGEQP